MRLLALLTALLACSCASAQCWGAGNRPAVAGPRPLPVRILPAPVAARPACCPCGPSCGCRQGAGCACRDRGNRAARPYVPGTLPGTRRKDREPAEQFPGGVDDSKLQPGRISKGGREISRAQAVRDIQQVADDSAKPRLTVIGPLAERKALRKALESEGWLNGLALVQDYAPDHWAVRKHKPEGLTVYLQQPDGTEMVREPNAVLEKVRDKLKRALKLLPPLILPLVGPAATGAARELLVPGLLLLIIVLLFRKGSN